MKKVLSIILILCTSLYISACRNGEDYFRDDDSYLEGIDQGELSSFLALWNSSYSNNVCRLSEPWDTDDFTLIISAKRGSKVDANVPGSEAKLYIEVDFSLNDSSIEEQWKSEKMLFYIYSHSNEGWNKVWGSDDYYWYFYLQGDDVIGRKGLAESRIPESTETLAVIVVINGRTYTASYDIDT